MTTSALAGSERALSAAVEALGADGVAALLPYLQSAAFAPLAAAGPEGCRGRRRRPPRASRRGDRRRSARARQAAPRSCARRCPDRAPRARPYTILTPPPASTGATSASTIWPTPRGRGSSSRLVVAQLPRLTQAVSHARLGAGLAPVRPRLRDAARNRLHERRAALEPRPDGRQHPLLPASGSVRSRRGRPRARSTRSRARSSRPCCSACCSSSPSPRSRSSCPSPPAARAPCSGSWPGSCSPPLSCWS